MRALCAAFAAALPFAILAAEPEAPLQSLPYTPGLDVSAMNRAADPCEDFYEFSCGGWIRNNPLPPDQSSWGVYDKLAQDNQRYLWGILESLADADADATPVQKQVGDYFAACMDEEAAEKLGTTPLAASLRRIAKLKSKRELPALLARLHLDTGDDGFLFGFSSAQDYADATAVIASASAGGLSLPDRDYYVNDDERANLMKASFARHVGLMFAHLGDKEVVRKGALIFEMEKALARASLTRVERRDPHKLFHKMKRAKLQALTPHFNWNRYLRALGHGSLDTFNVTEPAFFQAVDKLITSRSLDDLKIYLRWHLLHDASPLLSRTFVDENFDFFSRTLRGVPEERPRWKRCVDLVDGQLGEALGREFVQRAFSPETKGATLQMTQRIEQAMEQDFADLTWMGAETKRRALAKLHGMVNKIGYPDQWRDYGSIKVARGDLLGNVTRSQRFEVKRQLEKIGKPLDRGEWQMTPPTVNAYYDPQMNDLNFPAGVLQPPLYDPKMDAAPNYGNTGGTIGHELTHGFDDEGRQFDASGNLKDWWSAADGKAFVERARCIVDQYAQYTIVDDIKINSELTQGEDIADVGGLILAWMAWKAETAGQALEPRDGLTPEQRFLVGYAQWACETQRPEQLRVNALTDPHSPGKYRVNGVVVNLPEFQQAFSCKTGQAMAPEKRCRLW